MGLVLGDEGGDSCTCPEASKHWSPPCKGRSPLQGGLRHVTQLETWGTEGDGSPPWGRGTHSAVSPGNTASGASQDASGRPTGAGRVSLSKSSRAHWELPPMGSNPAFLGGSPQGLAQHSPHLPPPPRLHGPRRTASAAVTAGPAGEPARCPQPGPQAGRAPQTGCRACRAAAIGTPGPLCQITKDRRVTGAGVKPRGASPGRAPCEDSSDVGRGSRPWAAAGEAWAESGASSRLPAAGPAHGDPTASPPCHDR